MLPNAPGNCRRVLQIIRSHDRWLTFEDLGRLGMKQSERRRVNTLVKLGLVERKSCSSKATGHYAMFRPVTEGPPVLFDVAPERSLMRGVGPAVRSA